MKDVSRTINVMNILYRRYQSMAGFKPKFMSANIFSYRFVGNLAFLFLLGTPLIGVGQASKKISENRQQQIGTLVELIKNDRVSELATRISYPLKRPNPIPNIESPTQFILYYPTLFDTAFKHKLTTTTFNSSNTIDRYNGFGLFRGDVWLNDEGNIMTVNYNSEQELALLNQLHLEAEYRSHSSIKDWKENILVCQTEKFLIRIDLMNNDGLRYISWSGTKDIGKKPDLVLFNGKMEFQGTMGGEVYTFKNGDWVYKINHVKMAESAEALGFYIEVYQKGEMKMSLKAEEIK